MPYLSLHDLDHGKKEKFGLSRSLESLYLAISLPFTLVVPDAKRRLRPSLNSRYDRMIETMCLTRIYPSNKVRKKSLGTTRLGYGADTHFMHSPVSLENSVCPTAAISNDPKTIQNGEDFPCEGALSIPYSPTGKDSFLPGWLAETFATLPQKHPLRASLPPVTGSPPDTHISSDNTVIERHSMPAESEQLISFSDMDNGSGSPTIVFNDLQRTPNCKGNSLVESASRSAFQVTQNPEGIKPFSTPGPACTIFRNSTPPRLGFDNLDLRYLQTTFESMESSDRDSLHGLGEAETEGWQRFSAETDFIVPRLMTPAKVDKLRDLYSSPDLARAIPFVEVASFESEDESKRSPSYHLELTDLDFRWTAFDRKGVSQGSGPHNAAPDETDTNVHSHHSALGQEHTLSGRSPSPDDHFFHFQTVLNGANPEKVESSLETLVSARELFLTETNPIGLGFRYDSGVEHCQHLKDFGDTITSGSDE